MCVDPILQIKMYKKVQIGYIKSKRKKLLTVSIGPVIAAGESKSGFVCPNSEQRQSWRQNNLTNQ